MSEIQKFLVSKDRSSVTGTRHLFNVIHYRVYVTTQPRLDQGASVGSLRILHTMPESAFDQSEHEEVNVEDISYSLMEWGSEVLVEEISVKGADFRAGTFLKSAKISKTETDEKIRERIYKAISNRLNGY